MTFLLKKTIGLNHASKMLSEEKIHIFNMSPVCIFTYMFRELIDSWNRQTLVLMRSHFCYSSHRLSTYLHVWYCHNWIVDLPVTGKLHIGGLWLALLSDQHFIQEPTTTSTPAVVTNPHPPEVPEWYSLYHKLICLRQSERENKSFRNF